MEGLQHRRSAQPRMSSNVLWYSYLYGYIVRYITISCYYYYYYYYYYYCYYCCYYYSAKRCFKQRFVGEGEDFDAKQLHQHSQQLLHFLRQKCNREGGTYWLFREALLGKGIRKPSY